MHYSLRPATEYDLIDMYNISRAAHRLEDYGMFIPPSGLERFRNYYRWSKRRRELYVRKMIRILHDSSSVVLVAQKGGVIIGYASAQFTTPDRMHLKGLFVRPQYQGQGVGKALFEGSCQAARTGATIELEVLASNQRARSLYEKQGFQVTGHADKRFFGADLLKMVKLIH